MAAQNLGVSERNDFALLEKIGGECAGAVTFLPPGVTLSSKTDGYRLLTPDELTQTLESLPRHPLLAGEDGIRLSLAGAQSKLPVRVTPDGIEIPLGGSPSTHILKPAGRSFPGLIENEAFCLDLAASVGLDAAGAELRRSGDIDYLLIERYDRIASDDPNGQVTRLHQEDFCQALGLASERKYQNEGGPSLRQSFDLPRNASSIPAIDLRALLDAAIFNFLVGNHDAHGKNFSLLYTPSDRRLNTRMAPLYDLVCTVAYPSLSQKMAMKIGGEYESKKIMPYHFDHMAEEAGLAKRFVRERVLKLSDAILEALPQTVVRNPKAPAVAEIVRQISERTRRRFELASL